MFVDAKMLQFLILFHQTPSQVQGEDGEVS
jgi:hypothetical protein